MIKVKIFYKVSMYDSDWMMTEAEYDEFRKEANNLPVFFTGPKIKEEEYEKEITKLWNKIDEKDETIEILTKKPEEQEEESVASKSMGAGLIEKEPEIVRPTGFYEIVGIEEETGPEIVCENGACALVLEDEEPEVKERKKPGRKPARNFSKYIQLYEDGVDQKEIRDLMQDEMKIGNLTAEQYFYTYVKKAAKAKAIASKSEIIEKEKKQLLKELEPKINRKKVDPVLFDLMNNMLDYHSVTEFKDMCAAADIGRGKYSITTLKEVYLDTHPAVKW